MGSVVCCSLGAIIPVSSLPVQHQHAILVVESQIARCVGILERLLGKDSVISVREDEGGRLAGDGKFSHNEVFSTKLGQVRQNCYNEPIAAVVTADLHASRVLEPTAKEGVEKQPVRAIALTQVVLDRVSVGVINGGSHMPNISVLLAK